MATPPEEFVGGRLGRSSSSVLALSTSQYGKEDGDDVQIWLSYEKYDGREKHTMILRMFPNETIADVKLRVQARKGWFASQQQLKFGDMELEDSKTIEHVAMAAGLYEGKPAGPAEGDMPVETNHIHLSVHLADIMNVRIRTLEGEALLSAQPDHTVRELKEAVNLLNGYVPEDQHLLLGGKMLEDSKPLGEVGISENAIVHVLVKRTTKVHIKPTNGSQFELSISAGETVGSLKQRIEMLEGIPASSHKVVYNGSYLPENAPLVDYGVDENSVLMLEPLAITAPESESEVAEMNASLQKCVSMLKQAQAGFDLHMAPCLASAGTGGAYFLLGPAGNKVAVFKPEDEEPNAHNNPRGFDTNPNGEGLRKGTLPGEGASREYAAFLLDHGNFAGVPATTMVCLKQTSNRKYASVDWHGMHGKRGSLQVFVSCESDCEEMGVSQFECNEVHKIAILDMRLANTDRNGSNVLVNNGKDSQWALVPIDHGYCLPGSFADVFFDWLYWPQAKEPFDEAAREYITNLDPEKDLEVLVSHGITLRAECELVFRICNMVLQMGVKQGLCAFDLGSIMCREMRQQSVLEKLSRRALNAISAESDGPHIQGTGSKIQLSEVKGPLQDLYIRKMRNLFEEYLSEIAEH